MYYLVFIFLVCLLIIDLFFSLISKKNNLAVIVSLFIMILFAGLRIHVGYDYDNYAEMFKLVKLDEEIFVEPIFLYLIKFIQFFELNYFFFIFIIAFISILIKFKFLIKYSVFPILSVLIYYARIYLNADFGQIRQGLALGIVLFSYPYIVSQKFYKYTTLIVLASLIHAAAILFFPVYFFANKKFSKKIIIGSISLSILISFIDLKNVLFETFNMILPGGLAFKLFYYSTTEESLGITFSVILRLLIILYAIIFYWKVLDENQDMRVVFNIYYFGYLFYLVFNSFPQLGGRGSVYFQQFELLLLPFLFVYGKNKLINLFFLFFLIFYSFWGVETILNSVSYKTPYYFEPYESIFNLFYL